MNAIVALCAGIGLALFVSGLPPLRRPGLAERVDPYVGPSPSRARASGWWIDLSTKVMPRDRARTLTRLRQAGMRPDVAAFRMQQIIAGFGGVVLVWVVSLGAALTSAVSPVAVLLATVLGFASGWNLRSFLVDRRSRRRAAAIDDGLPTFMDLISIAVIAGESVQTAFERAGQLLGGPLGTEIKATVDDVRAGRPIADSLRSLAERSPSRALARMASSLGTAIELGSPIAETITTQAEDLRERWRTDLLAGAGRREVAMLVPVVFLILPVVVVFALFPGVVALDLLVP